MARVIAVANQKGGTGKSTTTLSLGAELAQLGQRILLVDLDPQGHLAEGFGIQAQGLEHDLSEVLAGTLPVEGVMRRVRPNLDLVPSNLKLAYLEPRLITQISRENKLKNALTSVLSTYDIILIDCPPSLGILTVNAFSAAQEVLIPMAAEFFAMVGVGLLLETLGQMRAELNPGLGVVGIVPTRVNRTRHAQEVVEQAKEELGQTIRFFSPIPEAVAVRDASAAGIPVSEYQASSPAAKAYRTVAKELLS